MFKSFTGFHLVEAYHKVRYENRFHPNKVFVKTAEIIVVLLVTLLLWNLPTTAFGIEGLTVVLGAQDYLPDWPRLAFGP